MSISEHNQILKEFYSHYHSEIENRGYCPGNWKWLIPPYNGISNPCYFNLNKMTEYTLKPAIISPEESWIKIKMRLETQYYYQLMR